MVTSLIALPTILLACTVAVTPLAAQRAPEVAPLGSRVRAWKPSPGAARDSALRSYSGRLVALTSDSLSLQQFGSADPRQLGVDQIVRLEISRGGISRPGGALRGAGIGALLLLSLAAVVQREPDADLGLALLAWYGTPIAVGGGALIGALAASGERWEPLPWPPLAPPN
jgi:hypothetical protein